MFFFLPEMLLAQSSAQKVKEIRAELVQEKSRGNQIEEHYKKKMEAQSRDVDALHIRMRQVARQDVLASSGFLIVLTALNKR